MRISDWSSDVCSSDLQSLAQELAPMKIRVNSVAPGAIRTAINAPAWNTPESLASLLKLIPYGRIGEPADVARAVAWLASDDSDYVTGSDRKSTRLNSSH